MLVLCRETLGLVLMEANQQFHTVNMAETIQMKCRGVLQGALHLDKANRKEGGIAYTVHKEKGKSHLCI